MLKNIADNGKVIFVGSMAGKITRIKSEDIKTLKSKRILAKKEELLENLFSDFYEFDPGVGELQLSLSLPRYARSPLCRITGPSAKRKSEFIGFDC